MRYEMEDIENILFDGDEEQMSSLPAGVSYDYSKAYDSFEVRYGKLVSKFHGLHQIPECVALYGPSYCFI